ncbi:CRISPR-associated DxTHG motif protein [Lactococcus allomyrinae]|uniref:CRISPR-associated DxTHG motif protein n=1 Tax=Lactococcus allomyrinae TaxID=2419773 RepID=A0A387BHN5_9LACT|nr:CRISPR-associated DxTHG motif protein [Lactococcus allomyrinae]
MLAHNHSINFLTFFFGKVIPLNKSGIIS